MADQHINPYASPVDTGETDARKESLKQLRGPSLALLILGIAWGGGAVLFAIAAIVFLSVMLLTRNDVEIGALIDMRESYQVLVAVPSCFIAYGARCMRQGIRYRVAVAAAVMACIPMISPMIWIGIPFGIWALIVLRRPHVRAAFADTTARL